MTNKEPSPLFQRTIKLVQAIPSGKILSYGEVAELISAPGCARHVSYILSSSSKKYKLPWHRVVGARGKISSHRSALRQAKLLRAEGVEVEDMKINLDEYLWKPPKKDIRLLLRGLPKHVSIFLRKK